MNKTLTEIGVGRITFGYHVDSNRTIVDEIHISPVLLSDDERAHLRIVAIAPSSDVDFCIRVIERLTGEKIIPANAHQQEDT